MSSQSSRSLVRSVERDEGKPEGHLKVMAPTTLTMTELGRVFCGFLQKNPGITLGDFRRSLRNPSEGGFDMAISGRAASYEGVVDVPLRPVKPLLCASPFYLRAHTQINHPRDLADCACLVFLRQDGIDFPK